MKIYCVLIDSVPFSERISNYALRRNIRCLRQFSHCYTKPSTISLMTGKLPSELESGGIGWKTHNKYRIHPVNHVLDEEVVQWPWADCLLTNELMSMGWNIKIHNGNFFNQIITNNPSYEKTTSYVGGLLAEMKGTWSSTAAKNFLFSDSAYYQNERNYIKKIQSEKSDVNTFYYITLHQYHTAISCGKDLESAEESVYKIFDYWDFEEENCLFYFFSDHGNFKTFKTIPSLDIFLTWAFFKDTTSRPINIEGGVISICDFYNLCHKKLEEETSFRYDRDRVYFMEDARAADDPNKTTLFSACRVSKWNEESPIQIEQTIFYKPKNNFSSFKYDLEKEIRIIEQEHFLKDILIKKYGEILE